MALSEYEQNVLEELERELSPASSPESLPRWLKLTVSTRITVGGVGVVVGLVSMFGALIADSAGGIVLALVAYGLITGSVAILVEATSQSRAEFAQRAQARRAARPPWYLR